MLENVAQMRRQYRLAGLTRDQLDADPIRQFAAWFNEAIQTAPDDFSEPNAMTLATADATGRVSARIVLLKGFDQSGFRFYTNYRSAKAEQLAINPHAALLFYWPYLERQIRIEGSVVRASRELSEKYFHERPRRSQLSAVASPQSQTVAGRDVLEQLVSEASQKNVGDAPIPLPEYWGGYELCPEHFEFWKGREDRLHDRFVYDKPAGSWQIRCLAP